MWIGYEYYLAFKGAPGAQAMQDAIATLETKAQPTKETVMRCRLKPP